MYRVEASRWLRRSLGGGRSLGGAKAVSAYLRWLVIRTHIDEANCLTFLGARNVPHLQGSPYIYVTFMSYPYQHPSVLVGYSVRL